MKLWKALAALRALESQGNRDKKKSWFTGYDNSDAGK
jgi:hypothetical protein